MDAPTALMAVSDHVDAKIAKKITLEKRHRRDYSSASGSAGGDTTDTREASGLLCTRGSVTVFELHFSGP